MVFLGGFFSGAVCKVPSCLGYVFSRHVKQRCVSAKVRVDESGGACA